jgi:hypothetical protein
MSGFNLFTATLRRGTPVLLALGLVACASPPQQEIDAANQALETAKTAGAETYAKESYAAAQQAKDALDAELQAQDGKLFKSYTSARELATQAADAARKAESDAVAGKEAASQAAQSAIDGAQAALDGAAQALETAPTGKDNKADVEAMKADVEGLRQTLEEARNEFASENFVQAQELATQVATRAGEISSDVTMAMTKTR